MRRSRIQFLREFLITQVNYWAVFPLVPTVLILSSGKADNKVLFNGFYLLFSLLPLLFYLLRRFIPNTLLFLLLHAVPVGLTYLAPMPDQVSHICAVALGGVSMLYSLFVGFCCEEDEDDKLSPLIPAVICGGCLFFLQNFGCSYPKYLYYGLEILLLCLYCLILYIDKFFQFISLNENSAGQIPEKEIFRSGMKQILGFIFGGALILFAVCNLAWLEYLLGIIKNILLIPLRFLLPLLLREPDTQPIQAPEIPDPDPIEKKPLPAMEDDPGWLWDLLLYIICFVIAVVLLILLVKAMIQVFRMIRAHLKVKKYKVTDDPDNPEFDVRERLRMDGNRRKSDRSFWSFLSINERVRKLYRKQAQRLSTSNVKLARMTARECAGYLSSPNIGTIYEKARYSDTDCSSEDLKQMKTACRKAKTPEEQGLGKLLS